MERKERLTAAERQRRYYARHKEERKALLRKQGLTTYTKYHKRYYEKKRKGRNKENETERKGL